MEIDKSVAAPTDDFSSANTAPSIINASTLPATINASTLPATINTSTQPATINTSTPPAFYGAQTTPVQDSWNDACIRFDVVTKRNLARAANFVILGMFVLLTIAAIIQGSMVFLDRAWSLILLWIGALIGWVLRDHKDPKRHDSE